jgi:DNA primase
MEEEAYLVEGYMDVISLSQSGLENVVAVSGTAFTAEQARLLKRFCQKVIMLFDGDEAGINASLRHMKTLIEADFDVRVVLFPTDEDPDSYMQKHGLSGFREYLKLKEQNFVEFILHILLLNKSEDPIAQAHAARSIAEHVALLKDPLKRTAYISQASRLMSWEEQVLINEVNKMRVQAGRGQKNVEDFQPVFQSGTRHRQVEDKEDYQEKQLLRTLVLHSDKQFDEELSVAGFIFKELEEEELWPATEPYSSVISGAFEHFKEGKTLNEHYFIRHPLSSGMAADILSSKYRLSDAWETNYEKYISTEEKNYKKEVIENLNYLKLQVFDHLLFVGLFFR